MNQTLGRPIERIGSSFTNRTHKMKDNAGINRTIASEPNERRYITVRRNIRNVVPTNQNTRNE